MKTRVSSNKWLLPLIVLLISFTNAYASELGTPPNNEIWYTSSDGATVNPYAPEAFGERTILSNTYQDGKGVITFDGTIDSVGYMAFQYCETLTSITLPNNVASIGKHAFYYCSSLIAIAIPNSVTHIDYWVFRGCSSLTSITIPSSVISINKSFEGCNSLESITVAADNSVYDSRNNCNAIIETATNTLILGCKNTSIPNTITAIGESAFSNNSSLTSITIPNSVTSIGERAFLNCSSLTSITIPNSVTSIGESAFWGCESFASITIPKSVTSIGDDAFNCRNLKSITVTSGNSVYDSRNNCNAIIETATNTLIRGCKNTTIPNGVISIAKHAFQYCINLTSIIIPNSVETIGTEAFYSCFSLSSITIGNNVTRIEDGAFSGCALNSVNIPNSVTHIGEYAFSNCDMVSVSIPEGITSISKGTFWDCRNMASITIPNSVTSIGEAAFRFCSSLSAINIPNSVTSIGSYAFGNNSSIKSVTIHSGVKSIGRGAFAHCYSLESIVVESGNNVYDSRENCNAIIETATNTLIAGCKNTTILDGIKGIGEVAFAGCSFSSIAIPNSVTNIGEEAFAQCALTAIIIPSSVTSIRKGTFNNCSNLTSIVIPNSIVSIEAMCFEMCHSLTTVTIPNSVTSIGEGAFSYCFSLSSITCEAATPPNLIGEEYEFSFYRLSDTIPVYVPCESLDAYKTNEKWAYFTNIQCIAEEQYNKIRYTSTDGNIVTPYDTTAFGANIISNTYENGEGIITFDGIVTKIGENAFEDCENLLSILLHDSIVTIDDYAFANCSQLSTIKFGKNLRSIGTEAFTGVAIDTLILPEGIDSISSNAFSSCANLKVVSIPSSLQYAPAGSGGESVFAGCSSIDSIYWNAHKCPNNVFHSSDTYSSSIRSIEFGDSIQFIPANFCEGFTELSTIVYPSTLRSIGESAFSGCAKLSSLLVLDSIVTIDAYAFANCSQLSNIKLGNSLRSIGIEAFTGVAIDTLILPEGIDSISSNAFSSCANLKVVSIPSSLQYAPAGSGGESVFAGCSSIDSIYWNAHKCPNNVFHSSDTYSSSIRSIEFGDSIQFIPANFCEGFTELSTIVYPSTLRSIGESAFSGCAKLSSSLILDSIATIDDYAFANCSQLSTIKFGKNLRSIGTEAFTGVAIDTLILPEGIDSISSNAFSSCANLKVVSIPSSLQYAPAGSGGESVFAGCSSIDSIYWNAHKCPNNVFHSSDTYSSSIRSIEFGDSIQFIPANFCEGFTELSTIVYPSTLRSIGESAFSGCAKLSSLLVLDSIVTIDAYAFANCSQLSNIKLGNSLRSIGIEAFTGVAIDTLILPEGIDSISSNAFSSCANLKVVSIPSSLQYAPAGSGGESVFAGCSSIDSIYWNAHKCPNNVFHSSDTYSSSIRSIEFGDSIQHIFSEFCMDFTALTNVILPTSLQSISDAVFSGCDNLDTIYCYSTTPPELYDEYVFSNYNATLYIPCEALDAYKSDAIWCKFSNIQCLDAPVPSDPCEDIIELDWRNGIRLSQLNTGWYKLYVGDIHAYQSGITTRFINDMVCPVIINRSYYANCEDREPIIEGSIMYELGETQQTMSYADFSSIVAPHIEYLYLNIASIVEDCEKDTIIENITDWVCDGSTYKDILGEEHLISSLIPDTHTWSQTVETSTTITIYNYTIIPIVRPVIMTNELLATIPGATPVLVAGEEVDVTGTLEAIKNYYYTNDTEAIADVDSVAWTAGADVTLACDAESHTMILELIAGCGFISHAELVFEVIPVTVTTTTETAIICEGETYQWQGISCSETGNYSFEVTNEVGCVVEIKTLQLTVIPAEVVTTADTTTICEGESYTWAVNAITYENLAAGIYSYADTIEGNCSRVITTLTLIVNASITKDIDIIACDFYEWNGQTYTQSGDYTYTTVAANGCDSIVTLHLTISPTLTAEETITACDSYEWNGQTYTQSGEYTYTTVAANGCDSIVTLHLTISPTLTAEETITACDSYEWNGQTYTQSGEYTYTTVAANGCDSIVTLHLTISPTLTAEETITACDSYEWNGQTYTQSGEYTYTTVAANGCDSIVTLHLTISPTLTAEETITACDSYEWNGQTYTQSGEYTYTTVAANGCDSIVTLHLTINQSEVGATEYATICYGETYTWNSQTYSAEGEYSITLSTANGCDSIVTLHLTILPEAIIMEESASINEEHLPYLWRGQQYYDAGKYIDSEPFTNYPYCDSVIYVLNLTVEAPNKCGDNLYWHYSNNTLSITGFGAMYDDPDLLSYRNEPWYPERVNHVVLPDAITHIGNVAFADCANLTNIVIPSSVTSIGDGAFSWTGLQSVTIPASVTNLGEQVFETCNNLHTILYEGTPNSISNQTVHPFIGCVHLDTIITPAALWHCTTADPMLEARYGVPHKARYIEVTNGELTKQAMKYIAKNSSTVEVLDLSATTNTTLPLGALLNNYRLSTLYLPDQIEVIPEMLAEGCYNLLEILIPATVTEIGNYAFAGCTNVWRMTVEAVLPPKVYDKTFDGIDRSISLIVPAGSEELYRQAEYWKEFFIENTHSQSPKSNCQKILHEDHILILREGKVYTTMGQLVK